MESWILPLITLIPLLGAVIVLFIPASKRERYQADGNCHQPGAAGLSIC